MRTSLRHSPFKAMKNPTVISLGGSLIVPDEVDVSFLKSFVELIKTRVQKGEQFIIITGGGRTARNYMAALKKCGVVSPDKLDWMGIYGTKLNAELVRMLLGEQAHQEIITDPGGIDRIAGPVVVGAGWEPGCSTDFDAVLLAEKSGAKKVINLSNIDYVYDKDPKRFAGAKKIERISWADFRKIIPEKYTPGLNSPFDPVAAKRAEELGLEVAIMNGKPLDNLENYLAGKPFVGTLISS